LTCFKDALINENGLSQFQDAQRYFKDDSMLIQRRFNGILGKHAIFVENQLISGDIKIVRNSRLSMVF
jgi:hypothetical protein